MNIFVTSDNRFDLMVIRSCDDPNYDADTGIF